MGGVQVDVGPWEASFWSVTIARCYDSFARSESQACTTHGRVTVLDDDDPEDEGVPSGLGDQGGIGGVAWEPPEGSVGYVFVETTLDWGIHDLAKASAHEIGLRLGLDHAAYLGGNSWPVDSWGIMGWDNLTTQPVICNHDWLDLDPWSKTYDRFSNHNIDELRTLTIP